VQFLHDLIYVHKVMPSPVEEAAMATAGGWGSGTITQFGAGKAAMALGGRWWLCTLRGYANLSLGAVEAPHYRDRLFLGYGRATLINRNSPRRQEALQFLLYMARQEYNELINAQADGLSPVIRWCDTPRYQRNPDYPQEDYNAVWREIMDVAVPNEVSPFVNGQAAQRILNRQLDLVKNDQKPVAEALRTAAQEINAEIQRTIARDPSLRARYERLVPSAASP
jgi:ABC-type glycerol-3-phosphate transport system substrate-binding protein